MAVTMFLGGGRHIAITIIAAECFHVNMEMEPNVGTKTTEESMAEHARRRQFGILLL